MVLHIDSSWQPSSREWDMAWRKCPYATYFQSREWSEIWSSYTKGRLQPSPEGLVCSDGLRIILPLSLECFFRGAGRRFIASPGGTSGGWLADVHLDGAHQRLVMEHLRKRFTSLVWRNNPYEPTSVSMPSASLEHDDTYVLDLEGGFDAVLERWIKDRTSVPRKVRAAKRAKVTVRVATAKQDWESYYSVYADSLRRWGAEARTSYSWDLFSAIRDRRSSRAKLWIALLDGKCIAGALCFYSSIQCVYWHGAALEETFRLRPVNLLIYEIIRDAADSGVRWFDFNPSAGLPGVIAFKRSFGAVPLSSGMVTYYSLRQRVIARLAKLFRPEVKL